MPGTRFHIPAAIGLTLVVTLVGCSTPSGSSAAVPDTIGTPKGAGKTITVWAMGGDLSTATLDAINAEFTKESGAKVKVQTQSWDGIITKITTALTTSTPPDVMDVGNTQIVGYAANGGLLDLTPYKKELAQGGTWVTGLEAPATVDGKLYGVPSFAANRTVLYNKTMWAKAGVTSIPKNYQEFTADLDRVKAANPSPDFSSFYYPGQHWYGALQWIWDAGGDIAHKKGDKWVADFASAADQKGFADFKAFGDAYSSVASHSLNTDTPAQAQIFADGKASAILAISSEIDAVLKANPKLSKDDLGSFPFPGVSGKAQPVLTAGSDWGISAKSQNKQLALLWAKIAASPDIQSNHVVADGWIPNNLSGIKTALGSKLSPLQAGFFEGSLNSRSTPAASNWATIEGDKQIEELFASIASGSKSPMAAATAFDDHLQTVLNGK